jgi:hypothetical protein
MAGQYKAWNSNIKGYWDRFHVSNREGKEDLNQRMQNLNDRLFDWKGFGQTSCHTSHL